MAAYDELQCDNDMGVLQIVSRGVTWERVEAPPAGDHLVQSPTLASALHSQKTFTAAEWSELKVPHLTPSHCVVVDGAHYAPRASHDPILCKLTLHTGVVEDELFATMLNLLRQFLRMVSTWKQAYVFIFDIHALESIPVARMAELQALLSRKRRILQQHLLCSLIITQSSALRTILSAAFRVYEPVRPVHIVVSSEEPHMPQDAARQYEKYLAPLALRSSG